MSIFISVDFLRQNWGEEVLGGHQTHCLLSIHIICPAEDKTFRQLRGVDPSSDLPWPETFGKTPQWGENPAFLCTQLRQKSLLDFAYYSDVWNILCIIWYFTLILHTSLHKYPVWGKHTNTQWVTHSAGQMPRIHAGSWGPLTVQQLSLQSKGNISCGLRRPHALHVTERNCTFKPPPRHPTPA